MTWADPNMYVRGFSDQHAPHHSQFIPVTPHCFVGCQICRGTLLRRDVPMSPHLHPFTPFDKFTRSWSKSSWRGRLPWLWVPQPVQPMEAEQCCSCSWLGLCTRFCVTQEHKNKLKTCNNSSQTGQPEINYHLKSRILNLHEPGKEEGGSLGPIPFPPLAVGILTLTAQDTLPFSKNLMFP